MAQKYFPAALNVSGRSCLVIGDNFEAVDKALRLAESEARVTLIARHLSKQDEASLKKSGVQIKKKEFSIQDLREPFFVVLALKEPLSLVKSVAQVCRQKKILLCAIDNPMYCDVVNVSVFDRGPLRMTVSTSGTAPAVSRKIRLGLEESLKDVPIEKFLRSLGRLREKLGEEIKDGDKRREKLIEATNGFSFKASMKLPKGWKYQ